MSFDISSKPADRQEPALQTEKPAETTARPDHASLAENEAFLAALYARPRNRNSGRSS
jgi:hypothetical protein